MVHTNPGAVKILIEPSSPRTGSDQATVLSNDNALPPISQLPTELLIAILRLALPRVYFVLKEVFFRSHLYMIRLYTIRSVTKRWQRIIDGTPSFWTIIHSTLPSHLREMGIRHSADLLLFVVYDWPRSTSAAIPQSAPEFLKSIAHTRQRWSAVALDYPTTSVSEYIGVPAPLLQTIIVRKSFLTHQHEPLELLGGDTRNLRHVDLTSVSIHWRVGGLARLRCLALDSVSHDGLTGSHLLDILRASPSLQVLKLHNVSTDTPPPSPLITLRRLWCIDLDLLAIDFVHFIMGQIRAPSCTNLQIRLRIGDEEFDVPRFINETMTPFEGILFAIHNKFGESEIRLDSCGFYWHTLSSSNADQGLSILIEDQFGSLFIRWVDRILQSEPGLRINFGDGAPLDKAVLGSVARMRCATKLIIDGSQSREDVLQILKFFGQPPEISTPLPSLPCLQELRITSVGLSAQDLLDMVQSIGRPWSELPYQSAWSVERSRGSGCRGPLLNLQHSVKFAKYTA